MQKFGKSKNKMKKIKNKSNNETKSDKDAVDNSNTESNYSDDCSDSDMSFGDDNAEDEKLQEEVDAFLKELNFESFGSKDIETPSNNLDGDVTNDRKKKIDMKSKEMNSSSVTDDAMSIKPKKNANKKQAKIKDNKLNEKHTSVNGQICNTNEVYEQSASKSMNSTINSDITNERKTKIDKKKKSTTSVADDAMCMKPNKKLVKIKKDKKLNVKHTSVIGQVCNTNEQSISKSKKSTVDIKNRYGFNVRWLQRQLGIQLESNSNKTEKYITNKPIKRKQSSKSDTKADADSEPLAKKKKKKLKDDDVPSSEPLAKKNKKKLKNNDVTSSKAVAESSTSEKNTQSEGSPINSDNKMLKNDPVKVADEKKAEIELWKESLNSSLKSATFRLVNEELYSRSGSESFDEFKNDPETFRIYQEGYAAQVKLWPMHPLKIIQKWLIKNPRNWVIADFGCGEAHLRKTLPNKIIHSLDLVASDPRVTVCDMANTPIKSGSVDVAVFCLSLMGTNISQFLYEANRVLRVGGIVKIAEVKSRFGKVFDFIRQVEKLGFRSSYKDLKNEYFWMFDFSKTRDAPQKKHLPVINLKPCLYKRR